MIFSKETPSPLKEINLLPEEERYSNRPSLWKRLRQLLCFYVEKRVLVIATYREKYQKHILSAIARKNINKPTSHKISMTQTEKIQSIVDCIENLFERVKLIDGTAIDMTNTLKTMLERIESNPKMSEDFLQTCYRDLCHIEANFVNHVYNVGKEKETIKNRDLKNKIIVFVIGLAVVMYVYHQHLLAEYQEQKIHYMDEKMYELERRIFEINKKR